MSAPFDDGYFGWLYNLVGSPRGGHRGLLRQLHATPFRYYLAHDANRAEDGRELRVQYIDQMRIVEQDDPWIDYDVSFLEMLIALSDRVAYNSYALGADWFWKLLENIELSNFDDRVHNRHIREVDEVLDRVMDREYAESGWGGLFPLRAPHQDQRRTELWYQMSAYLMEGEHVANGPQV